jgi:hypothetical protein
MTADYSQKLSRGMLWVNQNRRQENSPTHTGRININGVEHWISGWFSTTKNSMSLALGSKVEVREPATPRVTSEQQAQSKAAEAAHPELYKPPLVVQASSVEDFDDKIPF